MHRTGPFQAPVREVSSEMKRQEPISWSSLELRTTPNGRVPVCEVCRAVQSHGTLTTKPGSQAFFEFIFTAVLDTFILYIFFQK